ncbi:MAG: cupin domain-containing protein [Bacteroidota bacterium]
MPNIIQQLIDHYQFDRIPVEGTLYKSTYVSPTKHQGTPIATSIIGMYCHEPFSASYFHRLQQDETWHFYGGDAFELYLLFPDGQTKTVVMGPNILSGQRVQFTIPAHVWQAGKLTDTGSYALFGCTLAPGFTGDCFEGGTFEQLIQQFPDQKKLIEQLSVKETNTHLPEGFQQ